MRRAGKGPPGGADMIYLLEDDENIRELILYTLRAQGAAAQGFPRPSAFWQAVQEQAPSLVILDIMLPEEDGLQVLEKLRRDPPTQRVPVLMLTAKDSEYDIVRGLDSGADDYLSKPFGMMELLSRIRALQRRAGTPAAPPPSPEEYRCGPLWVCPARHLCKVGEETISLTRKEFDLLCLLLEHRGAVLTRDQLLDRIWGYSFDGESRTVDVHIRTLRQKLGEVGSWIETVRGIGYKLGGDAP